MYIFQYKWSYKEKQKLIMINTHAVEIYIAFLSYFHHNNSCIFIFACVVHEL
jgi:hypothetical protein